MKNNKAEIYKSALSNYKDFASDFLFEKFKHLENSILGNINIALSGGSTPLPILEKLKSRKLDWKRFNFFMVDERCVPITDESSNYGNLNKFFFKDVPSNAFSMVTAIENSFLFNSEKYEIEIENNVKSVNGLPQFELILLGMGDDGHTASLFPKTEGLLEKTKVVILNKVPQLNAERLTLTYPTIINASEIIVMLTGESKAKMIAELYATDKVEYPISKIVKEHNNLKWLIA